MKKHILFLTFLVLILFSCKEYEDNSLDIQTEETKQITWEKVIDFEEYISNFCISDDGKYIFYSNNSNDIYRINLQTNEKIKLDGSLSNMHHSYVHYIDGNFYMITYKDNKSYFGISNDNGDNITDHHVETHIFMSGIPLKGFLKVDHNRLLKLNTGELIVVTPSNMSFAISYDGGINWETKTTEIGHNFMLTSKDNKIYSLIRGWQGDFGIGSSSYLVQSSDIGESWLNSDLKYFPQAVDKQNNLISCSNNQFRKLNNNKWTLYEWENNTEVWGAEAINFKSGSNYISKIADIEFDNSNNLYLLVGNKSVFKTRLE